MRNLSKTIVSKKATLIIKESIMFSFKNIFNNKKEVSINLDANVKLTVTPAAGGGARATLEEMGDIFTRTERCYFSTIDELITSLRLTDEKIVKKLSKAF